MKVVAFNGSPRKGGNTSRLINHVFVGLQKENIETEMVWIGDGKLRGCIACMKCFEKRDKQCSITNDTLNNHIEKMVGAEGIILGSPTHFGSVSAAMRMFIDRVGMVSIANGYLLRRKVGAAVVAVRRGGGSETFSTINHLFFLNQMIVPGSVYWNFAFGLGEGEVEKDDEGMMIMKVLGENIAWTLKKLYGQA